MEMPEQEAPAIFSQMSQMFPNIPHDIIQMHVQKYSSDVEKCAEMLNQQNGKYIELQLPTLNNCENLNTDNLFQAPHLMPRSEIVLDNNNDSLLTKLPLLNSKEEEKSRDFFPTRHTEQTYNVPINITENVSTNFPRTNINFNEPLILNIEPDCDEMSHSWRPTMSADLLSSDLFVPSPMFESSQTNSAQILNLNFGLQNSSECSINRNSLEKERWKFNNSAQRIYDYPASPGGYFGKDVGSYLHYQKSQMNILRYEVIKAKIDLGDLRDCIEKLEVELKEKMQSKSVQDIIDLNKEIEQLRLDCQYLCTEIDHNVKEPVLLGEIDEKFYVKNESSLKNKDTQNTNNPHCVNSDAACIATQNESNKWQCLKCTFANHPAISSCEMCQSPKPAPHSRSPLFPPASSCYCHPKDKSLTIQS